jgi:hypothetical protein
MKVEFNKYIENLTKSNWNVGNQKGIKSNKNLSWKPLQQTESSRKQNNMA